MQLTPADQKAGKGVLYLVISAAIIDPSGKPCREHKTLRKQTEALRLLMGEQ